MSKPTLGDFKLHPTATTLKPKRTYRKKADLLYEVYELIRANPRISKQDIMIKADISSSYASLLLPELEKAGQIYKVKKNPARYRAHEPVKLVQPRKGFNGFEIKSSGLIDTEPVMAQVNAYKAMHDKAVAIEAVEFGEDLDKWFLKYAAGPGAWPENDLNHVNNFRNWVQKQIKEGN